MGLITVAQVSDGDTAEASDINTPVNTIANEINGNIDNANIKTGAAIATSKLATDAGILKGMLGTDSSWAWQSWTPTWTNVTIGNATVVGKYIQTGKHVVARLSVIWGNTTSASGGITFSLPVTSTAYPGTANVGYIGQGTMFDVSAGAVYESALAYATTTTVLAVVKTASGSFVQPSTASNTNPVTWANTDEWAWTIIYEAA